MPNTSVNSPKQYTFERCEISHVKTFIEANHYSENVNGIDAQYCFCLTHNYKLIGAMVFGRLAMRNAYKRYGNKECEVIELRRLCCIDQTPKNTESYFIAQALKYLTSRTTIQTVVSYADLTYGHVGTIYKASNFELIGQTSKGKVILYNGKRYHDKALRTKYKGKLKPFAVELREAVDTGKAQIVNTMPKNIYVYQLRKNKRPHSYDQLDMFTTHD